MQILWLGQGFEIYGSAGALLPVKKNKSPEKKELGPQNADFGPQIWLKPTNFWGSVHWTPVTGLASRV